MSPACDPRCTYWFSLAELERVEKSAGTEAAVNAVCAEMINACNDVYAASGGRMALALVFSPRLYSFLACRATIDAALSVTLGFQSVELPIYLQSPCYTGDMRLSVVMYSTLARLRDADSVIHGLIAAKAMRNLGLSAEAFEELSP